MFGNNPKCPRCFGTPIIDLENPNRQISNDPRCFFIIIKPEQANYPGPGVDSVRPANCGTQACSYSSWNALRAPLPLRQSCQSLHFREGLRVRYQYLLQVVTRGASKKNINRDFGWHREAPRTLIWKCLRQENTLHRQTRSSYREMPVTIETRAI